MSTDQTKAAASMRRHLHGESAPGAETETFLVTLLAPYLILLAAFCLTQWPEQMDRQEHVWVVVGVGLFLLVTLFVSALAVHRLVIVVRRRRVDAANRLVPIEGCLWRSGPDDELDLIGPGGIRLLRVRADRVGGPSRVEVGRDRTITLSLAEDEPADAWTDRVVAAANAMTAETAGLTRMPDLPAQESQLADGRAFVDGRVMDLPATSPEHRLISAAAAAWIARALQRQITSVAAGRQDPAYLKVRTTQPADAG